MFFTAEGLEQASSESVARWRASRFPKDALTLDLCCGIGGDSAQLGMRGPALAFDRNPAAALCASLNAEAYGVAQSVSAACADVTRLRLSGDAAFFDPSRRAGGRRARSGEEYSPPLSFARRIRERIPDLCIKVSPAIADEELAAYEASISFVSDSGECKEAVMWFGGFRGPGFREAVILPAGVTVTQKPHVSRPTVSDPRAWLFEPDPAVIRAHLIPEAAAEVDGFLIDEQIAYLTADSARPTAFGAWYRILEWMPFNLKRVRERMRALDGKVDAVKRRGVPMEPEEITRKLKLTGQRPLTLVLTRAAGKITAILCESRLVEPRRHKAHEG